MKKVVVTGASGFLGTSLVNKLLEMNCEVYAISQEMKEKTDDENFRLHRLYIGYHDYGSLSERISDNIDWFIHLAWAGVYGNASKDISVQMQNINAAVTAMLHAVKLNTKRFLFIGSSYQYRMELSEAWGGKNFFQKNLYGGAKAAASRLLMILALENNIPFNTVLFTNVFGVGDKSLRSTNTLILQMLQGKEVRLISGKNFHDWTYVDDAINGIISVLLKGKYYKEYYIGDRNLRAFRDIICSVRDVISPETKLEFGTYKDESYIDYSKIDLNALYNDTGFECKTDFAEAIQRTRDWIVEDKIKPYL